MRDLASESERQRNVRDPEAGLTLLELMFAGAVLAIALSMLFGTLVGMTVTSGLAQSRSIAVTHATSVMEELRALPFPQMVEYTPPTFGNLGTAESITMKCQSSDGTLVSFPVAPEVAEMLPNPLTVQCVVTWQDQRDFTYTKTVTQQFYR